MAFEQLLSIMFSVGWFSCTEDSKNIGEGGDEGCVSAVWHGSDDDCIYVVHVCNKHVLNVLEQSDKESPSEVSVHGPCVSIGKGGKT